MCQAWLHFHLEETAIAPPIVAQHHPASSACLRLDVWASATRASVSLHESLSGIVKHGVPCTDCGSVGVYNLDLGRSVTQRLLSSVMCTCLACLKCLGAGEGKYGAYPDRDVEAGHDPALGATPGAHLGGSPTGASTYGSGAPGYNSTTGAAAAPAYGATGTGGYGGTDAPAPAAVPGEKRRGGFLSLVGMGKKNAATAPGPATGMGTGAPSAPPPPAAGTYEQPPGGAASAWTTAGHGLSGAPAT